MDETANMCIVWQGSYTQPVEPSLVLGNNIEAPIST